MSEQPTTTSPGTRRYAHEVCPVPTEETGTRLDFARYHLARAQGFNLAVWEAYKTADLTERAERTDWASINFLDEAHIGFLYLHADGSYAGVRKVQDDMGGGETTAEWVWQRLIELGVDPDTIKAYGTRRIVSPEVSA